MADIIVLVRFLVWEGWGGGAGACYYQYGHAATTALGPVYNT